MMIRRIAAAFCTAALLVWALPATVRAQSPAPATAANPLIPANVRTLKNGLRVVVLQDHAAPVVNVATWYRFGSNQETPGKTGLAHALEHMMFRGTNALSSAALDRFGATLGAEVNAQTTNDSTHYYFTLPADRFEDAIRIEADRMRNLKLDPKAWNIERGAVLQEYAQDYSNPLFRFIFGINEKVFPGTVGRTALGAKEDIEKATVADLRRYYETWYHPNNATLVVTGDVEPNAIFAAAERAFGAIPAKPLPNAAVTAPTAASGLAVEEKAEFPFTLIDEAYAAPGNGPPNEEEDLRVQLGATALANPRGSFRKTLVDSGLTLGLIPIPISGRAATVFHVLAIVAPGHTAAQVRAVYEKTLAETLAAGIDPEFIAAAKRAYLSSLTYSRDSIVGLANGIGQGYVFPGDSDPKTWGSVIDAQTPEAINATLRRCMTKAAVIATLEPTTTDPSKAKPPASFSGAANDAFGGRVPDGPIVQPAWLQADLRRHLALHSRVAPVQMRLPNGLKLLVQRVATNPTVFVSGHIRSAPTFDPQGKEGLGTVTSSLLSFGSAKYDFAAQRKLADDLGAQIGFGQSFSAHGFARDLPVILDALGDSVSHPAFPADRLALVKAQLTASASRRGVQPDYRAQRALAEALLPPGDPELREDSPASLAAITLDDVKAYAAKNYRPDLTTLVIVGDVDPSAVRHLVEASFGAWTATGPAPETSLPPIPKPSPASKFVESSASDVGVTLVTSTLTRTSPDWYAASLANAILGGGASDARLFREAREKRGLVYGAYSSLQANNDRGRFTVFYRAVPSKVNAADAVVRDQIKRLGTDPISPDELTRTKTRLVASMILAEQATSTIAGDLGFLAQYDLPSDYYATLPKRYESITADDVRRAARTYLSPDHLVEVRVGPKG